MDPQLEQELYDEIRSAFTAVKFDTPEELMEVIGSVFTSSDHWTDRSDHYYLEPMHGDPLKPLMRFAEQKPTFSKVTFTMEQSIEEDDILEYAEEALTRSRGHLLAINYAMVKFFLRFGLLPQCLFGNYSREKVLMKIVDQYEDSTLGRILRGSRLRESVEDFSLSPIVLCGALRPSELLERAQGHTSVVVFPYQGTGLDEDDQWYVTAFLLEFPQPIEPVVTMEEAFHSMTARMAELGIDFSKRD